MLPALWKLIDEYTTKRSVMSLLATAWPKGTDEYQQLELAYDLSFAGHGYDTRDSGERYFRHVLAVVVILFVHMQVRDVDVITAAFLHDLPEDKPKEWPIKRVEELFNERVAKLVAAVTKPLKQKYAGRPEQHKRATFNKVKRGGKGAVMLKLADRLHNMLTLWGTPDRKWRKIYETLQHVMPMAVEFELLIEELTLATAAQIGSRHVNDELLSEVGHERTRK